MLLRFEMRTAQSDEGRGQISHFLTPSVKIWEVAGECWAGWSRRHYGRTCGI